LSALGNFVYEKVLLVAYEISRYFMAQHTKSTKIPTIAKNDHAGSEPSAVLLRAAVGFLELIALNSALLDLRLAFVSF
jgi:hypothetical protein